MLPRLTVSLVVEIVARGLSWLKVGRAIDSV
jgi:hypothetical protein